MILLLQISCTCDTECGQNNSQGNQKHPYLQMQVDIYAKVPHGRLSYDPENSLQKEAYCPVSDFDDADGRCSSPFFGSRGHGAPLSRGRKLLCQCSGPDVPEGFPAAHQCGACQRGRMPGAAGGQPPQRCRHGARQRACRQLFLCPPQRSAGFYRLCGERHKGCLGGRKLSGRGLHPGSCHGTVDEVGFCPGADPEP